MEDNSSKQQSSEDGQEQDDVGREGGHLPQHSSPSPSSKPHLQSINNKQQPPPTTTSHNSHSRSQSLDRPPPSTSSMDPTGMFRNRGRRVIGNRSKQTQSQRTTTYRTRYNIATSSSSSQQHQINAKTNNSGELGEIIQSEESTTQQQMHNKEMGEGKNHIERIMKREEPEKDHPPQSLPPDDPNFGDFITQNNDNSNANAQEIQGEKIDNHENNDGGTTSASIHNPIQQMDSRDSIDNEQQAHSTVGSTVSIMGSVIGEGEEGGSSSTYDEARLLAVKRRMMQDVEEVVEDDYDEEQNAGEEMENTDAMHDNDDRNISMECNADTDTSLLEDYPVNEILPSNVVNVADFSDARSVENDGKNITNSNEATTPKGEQESPLRAAFRSGLAPLTSQMLAAGPSESLKASASSAMDKAAITASLFPQLARQCFSFEDTTIDDNEFLVMPGQHHLGGEGGQFATHEYYGLSAVASFAPSGNEGGSSTTTKTAQTKSINLPDVETSPASHVLPRRNAPNWYPYGDPSSPFRVIRHSQTFSQGQSPRVRQSVGNNKGNPKLNGEIRQAASFDPWSPPSVGRESSWSSWKEPFQPLGSNGKMQNGLMAQDNEKKDWKNIETERQDAIDLLGCIVEQALNFNQIESESCKILCEKHDNESSSLSSAMDSHCADCLDKMKLIVDSIRDSSATLVDEGQFNHEVRSSALDALLRSYQFALEVKQSSLSANKWLESIGSAKVKTDGVIDEHNQSLDGVTLRALLHSSQSTINLLNSELAQCRAEIGRLKSSSRSQPHHRPTTSMSTDKSMLSSSSSEDSADNPIEKVGSLELCSPRPAVKLSESHDESFARWEKDIEKQMNLDARKEVLLLKAALAKANRKIDALEHQQERKEPFSSNIEPIKTSTEDDGHSEQVFMKIAEDIEKEALETASDEDSVNKDIDAIPAIKLDDPALEKELEEYRTALITSLREEESGRSTQAETITNESNVANDLSKSNFSEGASDQNRMINVRMLDGENFTTEWGDLAPTLPPPPEHGLNSPIVDGILAQWTDDPDTRSALMGWMENVLDGSSNADNVPSLKLSGLDHTVRDGFIMHVIPLLLRRKDVHVHLTTRAHRQTTYDIAVSVRQSVSTYDDRVSEIGSEDPELQQRQFPPRENKHQMMAFHATRSGSSIKENDEQKNQKQVHSLTKQFLGRAIPELIRAPSNAGSTHSTAVTTPISNRTPNRIPIHTKSRYTSFSSVIKKRGNASTSDETPSLVSGASPSLGDDLSVGSSGEEDDTDSKHSQQRQSTIMGSISGAFGRLSRNAATATNINDEHSSMFHTPQRNAPQSKPEEHPHQRVVSAPPGKIGITFVEYQGHTVVSNVSEQSPLAGWVFPSDVLVAIDDVPVRGLRTRDIVKLLTDRVGQQRNLRMVSSVAMNDLNGTV